MLIPSWVFYMLMVRIDFMAIGNDIGHKSVKHSTLSSSFKETWLQAKDHRCRFEGPVSIKWASFNVTSCPFQISSEKKLQNNGNFHTSTSGDCRDQEIGETRLNSFIQYWMDKIWHIKTLCFGRKKILLCCFLWLLFRRKLFLSPQYLAAFLAMLPGFTFGSLLAYAAVAVPQVAMLLS